MGRELDSTSRAILAKSSLQLDRLLYQRQLRDVFWPADKLPALTDLPEREHVNLGAQPDEALGAFEFDLKAFQAMNLVDEIDDGPIAQVGNGVGTNGGTLLVTDVEDADVLPRWQVDPEIGVESAAGNSLQDGGAHPRYLKPYLFLLERVNKSCERRKFSCICQRSSGVAARLRAKRCFSSTLNPRTRRIFWNTLAVLSRTVGG